MNLFAGQEYTHSRREQTCGHSGGRRRWNILRAALTYIHFYHSVQFSSVPQSCPTLCNPVDCSTPGLPVRHQLYTLPCVEQVNSGKLLYTTQGAQDNPEGLDWWGCQDGDDTDILTADSHCFYSRNQHNIVKQLSFNYK